MQHQDGDMESNMNRDDALQLMHEYVKNESLRGHMLAVEAAMRRYAESLGEDIEKWGIVGLLHDFDYERWPNPPDHPIKGSEILRQKQVGEDIIYAILSHADYMVDYPRVSQLDKALYACDELCGFLVACALVRPERFNGLEPKSVRKKLKNANFAAAVNRSDITRGAEDFGVDLDVHIANCVTALSGISELLFASPENH
jgi:putative nucleotidyltransferase with HDIG domain